MCTPIIHLHSFWQVLGNQLQSEKGKIQHNLLLDDINFINFYRPETRVEGFDQNVEQDTKLHKEALDRIITLSGERAVLKNKLEKYKSLLEKANEDIDNLNEKLQKIKEANN